MFKLVAFLFLMSGGVQDENPSAAFKIKQLFPTEEACKGYFATEDGAEAKAAIDKIISGHEDDVTVKFTCLEIEDNSI